MRVEFVDAVVGPLAHHRLREAVRLERVGPLRVSRGRSGGVEFDNIII